MSAGVLWLAGCGRQPAAGNAAPTVAAQDAPTGVALKPDDVERLGILVTVEVVTRHVPEAAGFGVVLAHEPIAQAVAELATAAAVERQSSAALARARHLAGTPGALAADVHEAAERQAAVDHAAATLARQRLTASFGRNPPWRGDPDNPVLRALAEGISKLVRVTFPAASIDTDMPRTLRLARLSAAPSGKSWTSSAVWNAPADAAVPGRSFFALLKTNDVGEGERLLAWSPNGAAESGVVVPVGAAVISDGKYWCYVERKPGLFVRTELDTALPVADGFFVKDLVEPGDRVVTHSAGLLLARETNPGAAAD
jgi:hypothetical protein